MKGIFYNLLSLIIFSSIIIAQVPTDGLVTYYPFNGNANDGSGNNNHGTVNGATLTTDRFGNENSAFSFDGNDLISASSASLPIDSSARTISIWVKSPNMDVGDVLLLGWGNPANYKMSAICLGHSNQPDRKAYFWGYGDDVDYTTVMNDNVWYLITFTYDGNVGKVYTNGQLENSREITLNTPANTTLYIGYWNRGTCSPFTGELDDISIYNRALSESEILELYGDFSGNQGIDGFSYLGSYNNNNYYVSDDGRTWLDSEQLCASKGGHLVTYTDMAENEWVNTTLRNQIGTDAVWFGLTDKDSEGSFVWVTGEPLIFTNWQPSEPNNQGGGQHYGNMGSNGQWDDGYNSNTFRCVLETEEQQTVGGLVAYYPFNENANDESGNGNDGTVNGATLTTDRFGESNSAYSFDGTNDYILIDDNTKSDFTGDFTISFWMEPNNLTTNEGKIIMKYESISSSGYQMSITDEGKPYIKISESSSNFHQLLSSNSVQFDNSSFITGIRRGEKIEIWINGQKDIEGDASTYDLTNSGDLIIGKHFSSSLNQPYKGILDDIRLYDRALSESDIGELYGGNSEEFDATLSGITYGPAISEIIIPSNGKGYIYFSLTANSSPVYYEGEFAVTLEKNSTAYYTCEAKFIDQGVLRLTIPAAVFGSQESILFTLPEIIQIQNNLYNIQGTPLTFTASLIPAAFNRTWDIFAGGSAGVSGLFGSVGAGVSASAAKLSVKGSGGVGFQIQLDESDNLFLDRRMEFSVGVGVEAPSINTTVDQVEVNAGVEAKIVTKTLVGQRFSFSGLGLSEERRKMAQSGFMLETLSLGAVGISPIVGVLLRAVITSLNSSGGVESTFDDALITNYWGLGVEGSLGAGLGLESGPLSLKAAEGGVSFALNTRINTHHRVIPASYQSYLRKTTASVGTSVNITQAIGYNYSALSAGLKFNDGVELNSGNFSLFDGGAGAEVSYGAYFNNSGNLDEISINLKGGGDVALYANSRSTYYSTRIDIPGEYSQLISDAGRGLSGLFVSGVDVPLGVDMVEDAVNSFKDTYASLENNPLKATTSETKGKGRELNFGISLDAALGVGLGLSLGVNGKYFDEIEYPKKYSEVYTDGSNYLVYSSEYSDEMEEAELSEIMKELFSGTVPLIKTAFMNIINKLEKVVAAGQEFVINVINTGAEVVGKIGGAVSNSGKWIVSVFSPNTPMVLEKAFEQPRAKQMYYSTNVKHKTVTADSKITMFDIETILVIVSESMNISFTPDATGEPIDSVDAPIEIKMVIDEQLLLANEFTNDDKDRIRIYRYDIDSLSWILEGGTLTDDTLKINTAKLGTFALGIELTNEVDNTPPEILEKGPQQGSTQEEYPEIYGIIRDDTYGFGIDLSKSMIILNSDTLDISYDPTNEKIFYQISAQDSINNGLMDVTIIAADLAGNSVRESFSFNLTSIDDNNIPTDYKLYQNYPNPFNPGTIIQFDLPERTIVTVNIYDIRGSYVMTVYSGELPNGSHKVKWNGKNSRGKKVSSGIYFYQLITDKLNVVKKMQLLK